MDLCKTLYIFDIIKFYDVAVQYLPQYPLWGLVLVKYFFKGRTTLHWVINFLNVVYLTI